MDDNSDVLRILSRYLQDLFDISPEKITLTSRLVEDLDLDSIDAVDLIVQLQNHTGKKISPTEFKSVRTVGDVVERIKTHFAR